MTKTKTVNLALQGGGAHGAYTWGVLDALLEDGRIAFEGISGTSAGAMNAVVLADGWQKGGADQARQALEHFWRGVAADGRSPFPKPVQSVLDQLLGFWGEGLKQWPGTELFNVYSPYTSPYAFNPLNINPLQDLLNELVDFDSVRACSAFHLFIAATRVYDGKVKVFTRDEMKPEAILASAALPFVFQAVMIDNEPYWDGGYMGNPVLFPFFDATETEDIVLVQINPLERREIPKSPQDIVERVSEITFNASLLRELRAIDFVNRLIEDNAITDEKYKRNRVHRIDASDELASFGAASKYDTRWSFFIELRDVGREATTRFLDAHFDDIGDKATLNLRKAFS